MDKNNLIPQLLILFFGVIFIMLFWINYIFYISYSKNEVVRVEEGLAIVKSSKLMRVYTIVTIDSNGNTLNEIKETEDNIKSYRLGE
jgi:hypothetical protein